MNISEKNKKTLELIAAVALLGFVLLCGVGIVVMNVIDDGDDGVVPYQATMTAVPEAPTSAPLPTRAPTQAPTATPVPTMTPMPTLMPTATAVPLTDGDGGGFPEP